MRVHAVCATCSASQRRVLDEGGDGGCAVGVPLDE